MKKILVSLFVFNASAVLFAQDPIMDPNTFDMPPAQKMIAQQAPLKKYDGEVLGENQKKVRLVYDTSLIQSIKGQDEDSVLTLLRARVDPNEKNDEGFAPIVKAAETGNLTIVTTLVEGGAQVNGDSAYGISALMAASAGGHNSVVKYLLEMGALIYSRDTLSRSAIIHAAMSGGDDKTINMLVEAGANKEDVNNLGQPVLLIALEHKNDAAAAALIAMDVDLNALNQSGTKSAVDMIKAMPSYSMTAKAYKKRIKKEEKERKAAQKAAAKSGSAKIQPQVNSAAQKAAVQKAAVQKTKTAAAGTAVAASQRTAAIYSQEAAVPASQRVRQYSGVDSSNLKADKDLVIERVNSSGKKKSKK